MRKITVLHYIYVKLLESEFKEIFVDVEILLYN